MEADQTWIPREKSDHIRGAQVRFPVQQGRGAAVRVPAGHRRAGLRAPPAGGRSAHVLQARHLRTAGEAATDTRQPQEWFSSSFCFFLCFL